MNLCLHCGTPVPPSESDQRFCCKGCAYVYDLLQQEGLGKFYDLRGSQPLPPVPPEAMRDSDLTWLQLLAEAAEAKAPADSSASLHLAIQGISCMACVWLVERIFQSIPGARRVIINAARGEIDLEWHAGFFSMVDFAKQLQHFGYLVGRPDASFKAQVQSSSFNHRVGLCGAFALNAMAFSLPAYLGMEKDFMFASWFDIIAASSATLSLLVGGSYFAERSIQSVRHGVLHMDTPITLGILSAWLGSMIGWMADIPSLKYFDFVSIFVFLMLTGRWLQQAALERNKRRLLQCSVIPEKVMVLHEGFSQETALEDVHPGDRLQIKPGEICPITGVLNSASASLSLEWINGESAATTRKEGQCVPSGALNIGLLNIEIVSQQTWGDSLLNALAKTRNASVPAPLFYDSLLKNYLAVVVLIGISGALWWWIMLNNVAGALQVMISIFVVSCPCALGVAAPFADDLAASTMERLGVFVRVSSLWNRLCRIRTVVFDKTGTLTLENPALNEPEVIRDLNREARQALHTLVASNLHPVSRSLFDEIGPMMKTDTETIVHEVTGQGLYFDTIDGLKWALGRPGWRGGDDGDKHSSSVDTELSCNGEVVASFTFTDALRPETVSACATLQRKGFQLHLLSGDRMDKVAPVACQLNIPSNHWRGEMTPEQKAFYVEALDRQDTLFIGDGANDSLALEKAFCNGSPVTGRHFLEHKADFYFLGSSLRFIPNLLDVACKRRRAVHQIFAFALLYNLGAIVMCLNGWMNPLLAAILMPTSSAITLAIVQLSFGFRSSKSLPDSVKFSKPAIHAFQD